MPPYPPRSGTSFLAVPFSFAVGLFLLAVDFSFHRVKPQGSPGSAYVGKGSFLYALYNNCLKNRQSQYLAV